jgi:hypothetical protein
LRSLVIWDPLLALLEKILFMRDPSLPEYGRGP